MATVLAPAAEELAPGENFGVDDISVVHETEIPQQFSQRDVHEHVYPNEPVKAETSRNFSVDKLGKAIEQCSDNVDGSLGELMQSLAGLATWKDDMSSLNILPTNVLSGITVIGSKLLRNKTALEESVKKLRLACQAAAPQRLLREVAALQTTADRATQEVAVFARRAKVAEAKAHALDNRVALKWLRFAYTLQAKRSRFEFGKRLSKVRQHLKDVKLQLTNSINAREQMHAARQKKMTQRIEEERLLGACITMGAPPAAAQGGGSGKGGTGSMRRSWGGSQSLKSTGNSMQMEDRVRMSPLNLEALRPPLGHLAGSPATTHNGSSAQPSSFVSGAVTDRRAPYTPSQYSHHNTGGPANDFADSGHSTWRTTSLGEPLKSPRISPRVKGASGGEERGMDDISTAIAQSTAVLPVKETYTRSELLDLRLEHSKQLQRLQAAYEDRLRANNEYWKVHLPLALWIPAQGRKPAPRAPSLSRAPDASEEKGTRGDRLKWIHLIRPMELPTRDTMIRADSERPRC
ncbi:hypothetical protein CYMTET_25199 [Cymbomonas tetramitiformis]|uniref:Uncharacterized protein n=1 Tax=Cymbomonas tetramitiformis TaxID=36881 RepID=A0AAE0FUN6_9CHLO|nr:hypothetical protein CYMTET_25199 [Cymbomonas tetramitiformis]